MPSPGGFEQKLLDSDQTAPMRRQVKTHEEETSDVEGILQQLTLAEKVGVLSGNSMWSGSGAPRLNLDALRMSDGPHGMRGFCIHGDDGALLVPCEMAMAATFDENVIMDVGDLLGEDCARRGGHVLLGPCLNMQRIPTFGRHFECFSEDPYLSARAAVAYIKGCQRHAAACAKHFVCNDQEDYRHTLSAVIDERALREVYLAPFEAAVREADVESIMCGYNRLNGTFCTENKWLLQNVLREEWGFRGWLVSDWFGNQSTEPAINAGLNVEMPGIEPRHYGGYLLEAAKQGKVSDEVLDARCRPVLRSILRHAGKPKPGAPAQPTSAEAVEKRRQILHRAAAGSHVLLRNEGRALPLDTKRYSRIAVIGPFAADTTIQGGGSSRVRPRVCASILDALRSSLPKGTIIHEPGCYAGELSVTTAEFEALKPMGACNASGQPLSLGFDMLTRIFDTALFVAGRISNIECFRRFFMPVLRFCGVRTPDPVAMGEQQARDAEKARSKLRHADEKDSSQTYVKLACLVALAGAGVAAAFAAGAWGKSWVRMRIAMGALSFVVFTTICCSYRIQARRKRVEDRQLRAAEEAARQADASVIVLGSSGFVECEGMDRPDMLLPGRQNELVERVSAAAEGRPIIVVLNVGSPKELPWLSNVSAVLLAAYGGEETGAAVADTLLGVSSPSGRLPMTWPKRMEDVAAFAYGLNGGDSGSSRNEENTTLLGAPKARLRAVAKPGECVYREGLRVGYRAYGAGGPLASTTPLFAFGHGLSYTTFEYSCLEVQQNRKCADSAGAMVLLSVSIRNTGSAVSSEVVQVYSEAMPTEVQQYPGPRALCAFTRTKLLQPRETCVVQLELTSRALGCSFSEEARKWLEPPAGQEVRLEVGASSDDIRITKDVVLQ